MLTDHGITQSMSRKGNCLDNSVMENFFGRLKTEMFFGEQFRSVKDFERKLHEYICCFNNERISFKEKRNESCSIPNSFPGLIKLSNVLGSPHIRVAVFLWREELQAKAVGLAT